MRAFIAIELPDNVKKALSNLQSQLKSGGQTPVKWVDPNSVHLTLKFLGDITIAQVDSITGAMKTATTDIPSFGLTIRELGVFPNLRRVQVIWVGIEGDIAPLSQLQQRLESNLTPLGFTPESRPFTPHLTLARVRERATNTEKQDLGQLITGARFEEKVSFTGNTLSLMRSRLTPQGAVYHRIAAIKLK